MSGLTYERITGDLREKNYAEVPFPISGAAIDLAAANFMAFLSLPQYVKDAFYHLLDPDERGSNAGYARKSRANGDSDDKEYFNFRAVTLDVFHHQLIAYTDYWEVEDFLMSARLLYQGAVDALKSVIAVLDEKHPGISDKIFKENPERYLALRFVRYERRKPGQVIATAHYDRATCDLAVAESAPGLRIGRDEDSLKLVARQDPESALFMPAFTFGRDVGTDAFHPAWHDVVQTGDSKESRWAIVLFADTPKDGTLSYLQTHTPMNSATLTKEE